VWFKHRAWIPIAWLLCVANIGATWFAAQPAETWHATAHALLAALFGVGAQRLMDRQRALKTQDGGAELPSDITAIREEIMALRQGVGNPESRRAGSRWNCSRDGTRRRGSAFSHEGARGTDSRFGEWFALSRAGAEELDSNASDSQRRPT